MRTIFGYAAGIFFAVLTIWMVYKSCQALVSACKTKQWKNIVFTLVLYGGSLIGWAWLGFFSDTFGVLRWLFTTLPDA